MHKHCKQSNYWKMNGCVTTDAIVFARGSAQAVFKFFLIKEF